MIDVCRREVSAGHDEAVRDFDLGLQRFASVLERLEEFRVHPRLQLAELFGGRGQFRIDPEQRPLQVEDVGPVRFFLTGKACDAQRAFQLGLVSQVTKPEALLETALALGREIATNSPALVQAVVRVLWQALELPLSEALEASLRAIAALREQAQTGGI